MAFSQLQTGSYCTGIQRTSIILSILAVLPVFLIEENYEAAYSRTKNSMLNKKRLKRLQCFFTLFRKWNKAAWRKVCSTYLKLVSIFDSFHNGCNFWIFGNTWYNAISNLHTFINIPALLNRITPGTLHNRGLHHNSDFWNHCVSRLHFYSGY